MIVCRDDEVHLFDRAELELTAEPSIDALRHLFKVTAPFAASSLIARGEAAAAAVQRALQRGTVFTAAQCLGLAERMIHIAVEYAKQRVQFGKPIGSYQAIKHHLATAQVKLEFARPVVYAAAARVADLDARAVAAASHAKLAAFDAAELAARSAFQVHGAMGYSWEVDLHFYMKRAWALGGVWSSRGSLGRGIQSLLLSGELDIGPDTTFMRGK